MKKIVYGIVFIVAACLISKVFAEPVTTVRKINPQAKPSVNEIKKTPTTTQKKNYQQPSKTQQSSPLSRNMKMCKPYKETMVSDMGGVDFNFLISIDGWVDNKCVVNFNAQSSGINSMFKSLYGVDASQAQIYTFEPKIRCAFTRQQLEYVGDSILQEEERKAGVKNNMLKNPNNISISSSHMSQSDERLLDVVLNQGACKILNGGDMGQMLDSLLY